MCNQLHARMAAPFTRTAESWTRMAVQGRCSGFSLVAFRVMLNRLECRNAVWSLQLSDLIPLQPRTIEHVSLNTEVTRSSMFWQQWTYFPNHMHKVSVTCDRRSPQKRPTADHYGVGQEGGSSICLLSLVNFCPFRLLLPFLPRCRATSPKVTSGRYLKPLEQ